MSNRKEATALSHKKHDNLKKWRLIMSISCVFFLIVLFLMHKDISVAMILNHTPENNMVAAAIILMLYFFKSVTLFFPLIILEIAAGHLFPLWMAFFINFFGTLIDLTVPYWIGRAAGMDVIQKVVRKYPKFEEIINKQQNNSFFLCFFLREISCLPGDIVTMYFGATQTSFGKNIIGGMLGILPGMILATCMGEGIQNVKSPMFWISAVLTVFLSVISIVLYYLYRRKWQRKEKKNK